MKTQKIGSESTEAYGNGLSDPCYAFTYLEFWQQGKINVPVVINIVILIGAREDICLQLSQGTLLAAKSRICPTRLAKTSGIG